MKNANGSQIFVYLQSVTSYLSPPLGSVFLLGMFWKRSNETVVLNVSSLKTNKYNFNYFKGAFWGLMVGLVIGLVRLFWEFAYSPVACGEVDPRPSIIKINYLYFSIILWAICTVVTIVISLLTKRSDQEQVITN